MAEVVIRNKDLLKTLDDTLDMFLEHKELCYELASNLQVDVPVEEWEKYCQSEYLYELLENDLEHIGFPEKAYGFQVAPGAAVRPDVFEPLKQWTKHTLPMLFGARSNSLTSFYPPNGFVGWHTNWNAHGYQIIITWSETGDGYFSYYDAVHDEIITEPDVAGWQARWYRFGRKDEPDHHFWHTAWTNCPRFTLAFKFPYGDIGGGIFIEESQALDAIHDFVDELESP